MTKSCKVFQDIGLRRRATVVSALFAMALMATSVMAQDSRRHDPYQPIQINADALEVRQDQSIAIFSGNVDAIQGNIRLQAQKLIVFYQKPKKGGDKSERNTISKIEASGGVFVSTPSETAKGASGIYNVQNRTITLIGNVVLTRGKNVIRGNKLTLNLATGLSRLEGSKKKRVTAIVNVPKKKEKNQ